MVDLESQRSPWSRTLCVLAGAALVLLVLATPIPSVDGAPTASTTIDVDAALPADLAALPGTGLRALGQVGGSVTALASESERPILWAAVGPRVLSYELATDGPRLMGKSPVLPATIAALAADAGRILIIEDSPTRDLWLLDGREPSWPRTIRRLRLGGPVDAIDVDGTRAVAVIGQQALWLDLADPARPLELARHDLRAPAHGLPVRSVSLEAERAAFGLRSYEAIIVAFAPEGPRELRRMDILQVTHVVLSDPWLIAIGIQGVYVLPATPELARSTRPAELRIPWPVALSVRGDEIRVMSVPHGRSSVDLLTLRVEEGPILSMLDRVQAISIDVRSNNRWAMASSQSGDVMAIGGARVDYVPRSTPPSDVRRPTPQGVSTPVSPSYGSLTDIELVAGHAVVGGALGAHVLDTQWPDLPVIRATWDPKLESSASQSTMRGLTRVGEAPIAVSSTGLHQLAVGPDGALGERGFYRGPYDRAVIGDEQHVFTYDQRNLRVFDVAGRGKPWPIGNLQSTGPPLRAMALADGRLWLARGSTLPSGILQAVDVRDPSQPAHLSSLALPGAGLAMLPRGRILSLLWRAPDTSSAFATLDISDPQQPRVLSELDMDPIPIDPIHGPTVAYGLPTGDMAAFGDLVALAHPGRGVVLLDVRVPDHPTELGHLKLPGIPEAIASDGTFLWVATRYAGVFTVGRNEHGAPAPKRSLAWLPVVRGGRH